MLMAGTRVVTLGASKKRGLRYGELARYRCQTTKRSTELEGVVAGYAQDFCRVEEMAVPKGAHCRRLIMETLDPGNRWAAESSQCRSLLRNTPVYCASQY